MKRSLLLTTLLFSAALGACSGGWFGDDKDKKPLPGTRVDVLDFEKDLRPDAGDNNTAFVLGDVDNNDSWQQAGGQPDHSMANLALSSKELKKAWSADIGEGSRSKLPLTAQPVVAGKSVFTLDTDSELSSFDTSNGKRRWQVSVRDPGEGDPVISGGIATDGTLVYVTAGYDELVAVDAAKGDIKWRAKLTSPSRAAPTVTGGRVFVTTLSNSILSIDAKDGKVQWEFTGLASDTGLVGAASPAANDELVVPAFSSGEVYALRSGNGSVAWSDNLSNSLRLGGLSAMSDIRGLPVIDGNMVYAISFAGKMAAIDLNSGNRVWQKDISGSKTPWVSGNRVYLISTESQIISLDKAKGGVVWVSQLARFKNKEEKKDPIFWTGPLMAGNRLLAFSSDGRIAEVDPEKGTLIRQTNTGEDIRISPIVAGGTLYFVTEDGDLMAYR